MVDRNSASVRQFASFLGFAAFVLLLINVFVLAIAAAIVPSFYQPKPHGKVRDTPDPDWRAVFMIDSRNYQEVAAEFDRAFLGPYAHREEQLELFDGNRASGQRVLVVAPGVRLSPRQEALAATVYVDISISGDGKTSLPMHAAPARPSPDEQIASSFAASWRFDQGGVRRLSKIARVPVRILHFSSGVSGVVGIPGSGNCEEPTIQQSYWRSGWGHLSGQHQTTVTADGNISFTGSGDTLLLNGHASVSPVAVQRSFKRVLTSDLLQVGASIGAWRKTDSGHSGSFAFECAKQTLLTVQAEAHDERPSFDINVEIEQLAGIKRWSTGSDDTPAVLDKNSSQFRNLNVLRGVAENGSAKGVLALAANGMPMTEEEQKANSASQRVNVLEIMAQRGAIDALHALLASSIRWSKSQLTDTLVIIAGVQGDPAVVNDLINAGADPRGSYGTSGRTVLMAAASTGHPDVIARILQFSQSVNLADKEGNRAIHYAARAYPLYRPRVWASPQDRLKGVSLLLAAGATVDAANLQGETALMLASSRLPDLVEALLKSGADPNARDTFGRTPLMHSSSLDAVKMLLAHGANIRLKGKHGETVLNSLGLPDAVPLLIAAGADGKSANDDGRTPLMMMAYSVPAAKLLIANGGDVNARDSHGQTVLMKCPSADVAQVLLEAGANPWLRDWWGKSASDRAAEPYAQPRCKETGEVIARWTKLHR